MRIDPESNRPHQRIWPRAHELQRAEEDALCEHIAYEAAYETLPPHLKQVAAMRMEGKSRCEVAAALGITEGQAITLLRHLNEHFQRELGTG